MSGYCSIGSAKNAPIPPSITMIASSQAKIGRSMKISEMAGLPGFGRTGQAPSPGARRGDILRRAGRHRPDLAVVFDVVAETLGDHAIAGPEPGRNHPVGAVGARGGHLAAHRLAVGADDVDE